MENEEKKQEILEAEKVNSEKAETNQAENANTKQTNKIVETIKAKKRIIGVALIAIILIIVIINIVTVSPKEAVKKCVSAIGKGDMDKALDYVDIAGASVFSDLDEDDYDDFWSEYKDFKDSDEYDDLMDEYKDGSDEMDDLKDEFEDYDISLKVEKIKSQKKVSKNLYKVVAKVEISYEDNDFSPTLDFYVMKKGSKSYVVGLDSSSLSSLFSELY